MPRSDQDAVTAFPLHLIRVPMLAEVIDYVFSDRLYSAFFPRDVAYAVTMSILYIFGVSPSALSAGEISHAPVPVSLFRERSRERVLFLFFFSLRYFPVPILPPLFE